MNLVYVFVLRCALFAVSQALPHEAPNTLSAIASLSDRETSLRIFRRAVPQSQSPPGGFTVEYTLITVNSPDCNPSLYNNFPVKVQYRDTRPGRSPGEWRDAINSTRIPGSNDCAANLTTSAASLPIHVTVRSYSLLFPSDFDHINSSQRVQLRLVQSDHRGGFCDCWAISSLRISFEPLDVEVTEMKTCDSNGMIYTSLMDFLQTFALDNNPQEIFSCIDQTADTYLLGFCRGSASVPRGFVLGIGNESQCDNNAAVVDTGRGAPLMGDQCESMPHVSIEFHLKITSDPGVDTLDEGIEFGYQINNDREWVPIAFFSPNSDRYNLIRVGNTTQYHDFIKIRGYNVSLANNIFTGTRSIQLKLCGREIMQNNASLSFRWLQTVISVLGSSIDTITVDNVRISINSPQQHVLLMDDFNNQPQINSTKWMNFHRVSLSGNQLEFGEERPIFGPFIFNRRTVTIISRGISTVPVHPNFLTRLSYTLIRANSPDCLTTSRSFTAPPPRLQYRLNDAQKWMNIAPDTAQESTEMEEYVIVTRYSATIDGIITSVLPVHFRFVQFDHHGGFCNCWAVVNLTVIPPSGQTTKLLKVCGRKAETFQPLLDQLSSNQQLDDDGSDISGFCMDSASIPRVFVAQYGPQPDQGLCSDEGNKVTPTDCSESDLRVEIAFDLEFCFDLHNCQGINDFNEGVELSFRSLQDKEAGEWVPLMYFTGPSNVTQPSLLEFERNAEDTLALRGYNVSYIIQDENHCNVSICGEDIFQYPLQFRWLQTSYQEGSSISDVILLDNVTVSARNGTHNTVLFEDCFDDQNFINPSYWDSNLTYNVQHSTKLNDVCKPSSDGALFYLEAQPPFLLKGNGVNYTISSRQIVTNAILPSLMPENSPTIETEEPTTATETTTTNSADTVTDITTVPTSVSMTPLELNTLAIIGKTPELENIHTLSMNGSLTSALMTLNDLLSSSPAMPRVDSKPVKFTAAAAYLLSATVNRLQNQTVEPAISEILLSTASNFLDIAQRQFEIGSEDKDIESLELQFIAVSTLLQLMDEFALNNHNTSHQVTSNNIVFRVKEVSVNETSSPTLSLIEGEDAGISIPTREVLEGLEDGVEIRMASLFFRNMTGLLPESIDYEDSDSGERVFRLASPVISASFKCDTCTTSNLSTPVQVTFKHTPYDKALLESDHNGSVTCVFWKFNKSDTDRAGAVLYPGQWAKEGCETNFNSTMTVCKCDHLTHFAILLSARPLNIPRSQTLALQITGYIGVSISLVAMAATMFVFIFLKALRTMRNYIHIQLCVTLGIAQIVFVAGIEPRLGEGHLVGGVPVGCRLVAVLLHYWFLVSFMWMLMEGVVLYVALVRIFIKYHARYIAAFTIASYGLPLLYVGGLTVPLGFARSEEMRRNHTYDYGYEQACYLNPVTSFIWSFIAPVILILLANIGFFIMAIAIMYSHQRRHHNKDTVKRVRHWLKVSISLTVVMGITWIIGVLVIEIEQLFALAYIFTIFVAFQGLFIFVIFVLLSKQVRENYLKWWKAKVAESDILSSYFGEKHLTHGTSASSTAQQNVSIPTHKKSHAQPSTDVKKYLETSQVFTNSYIDESTIEKSNHEFYDQNSKEKTVFSLDITYVPSSPVAMDTVAPMGIFNVISTDKTADFSSNDVGVLELKDKSCKR